MEASDSIPLIYDYSAPDCVVCEGETEGGIEGTPVENQQVRKSRVYKKARRRVRKPLPEALISDRKLAKALKNDLGRTCFKDTLKLVLSAEDRGVWGGLTYTPPEAELLIKTLGAFNERTAIALELPFWATFQLAAQFMAEKHSHIAIPGSTQQVALCLYTVVLATSGESKTWSLGRVMSCIETATGWQPETIEEPASTAFFIQALKEKEGKPILMCIDEIGPFWDALKKSEAHAETKRLLLKLYDVPKTIERGTMKYRLTIRRPHFSMLGTGVYETFSECMEPADWESGMAARIGFIKAKTTAGSGRRDPFFLSIDEASIKDAWLEQMDVPVHETYRLNAPAVARLEELWDYYKDEVQISKAFTRRILFRVLKYAAVYHWLCKKVTDVLDEHDMNWAVRLGQTHIADLQFILDDSKLKDYRRLLKIAGELKSRMEGNGQEFNARQLYMRNRHLLKSMADANLILECMRDEANVDRSAGGVFDLLDDDTSLTKSEKSEERVEGSISANAAPMENYGPVRTGEAKPLDELLSEIPAHLSAREALQQACELARENARPAMIESLILPLAMRWKERDLWAAKDSVVERYKILPRTSFIYRVGENHFIPNPLMAIEKVIFLSSEPEEIVNYARDFWEGTEVELEKAFIQRQKLKFPALFSLN